MADCAIIFDVDGVLLELTRDEEEVFFEALSHFVPTQQLSRDWNSYKIRNDEDIIIEILAGQGLEASRLAEVKQHYLTLLQGRLQAGLLHSQTISGAVQLLHHFNGRAKLGIATANLLDAARFRLQQLNLWSPVCNNAQGADGGGHKHQILARLLARMQTPTQRIVYIGDNLNDLEAGQRTGVHFIGFSRDKARLEILREMGAIWTSDNHMETTRIVEHLLNPT